MAEALAPLAADDLAEVCALEIACFATPWSRPLFEAELARPDVCRWWALKDAAAPAGRRVLAYGGYWRAVDEAHFTNLAVRPDARGAGRGRAVLRALLAEAAGLGCVRATLEVRPSNLAALALYRSEGFEPAAIRPRYYTDNGEDALILWKNGLGGVRP